jgi:hypothetical protein
MIGQTMAELKKSKEEMPRATKPHQQRRQDGCLQLVAHVTPRLVRMEPAAISSRSHAKA